MVGRPSTVAYKEAVGVSTFELTRALPVELASSLPSIEQIERELGEEA